MARKPGLIELPWEISVLLSLSQTLLSLLAELFQSPPRPLSQPLSGVGEGTSK